MSVSLEIVVRLFFSLICIFEYSAIRLYNEIKKRWWLYERKEKSFVCGQWGTEHFVT